MQQNLENLRFIRIKIKTKIYMVTYYIPYSQFFYTTKNYHLFKVVENRMQQCCAAHIVHSCQQYCSALLSLNQPQSGVTMLNNIVDNYEQYGQHNIVACFQQP